MNNQVLPQGGESSNTASAAPRTFSIDEKIFICGRAPDAPDACKICHRVPRMQCARCKYRFCSLDCATLHKVPSKCTGVSDLSLYSFYTPDMEKEYTALKSVKEYALACVAFRVSKVMKFTKPVFNLVRDRQQGRLQGPKVSADELKSVGIKRAWVPLESCAVRWDQERTAMCWRIEWLYDGGGQIEKHVARGWDDVSVVELHNQAMRDAYITTEGVVEDKDVNATIDETLWIPEEFVYGGKIVLHRTEMLPQSAWGTGRRREFYLDLPDKSEDGGIGGRRSCPSFLMIDEIWKLSEVIRGRQIGDSVKILVTHRQPADLLALNIDVWELSGEGTLQQLPGKTRLFSPTSTSREILIAGIQHLIDITDAFGAFTQLIEAIHSGNWSKRPELSQVCENLCDKVRIIIKHRYKEQIGNIIEEAEFKQLATIVSRSAELKLCSSRYDNNNISYHWRKFRERVQKMGIDHRVEVVFRTRLPQGRSTVLEGISGSLGKEIRRVADALAGW